MNGKEKCKILKEIRQKIANENNISYVTSEYVSIRVIAAVPALNAKLGFCI